MAQRRIHTCWGRLIAIALMALGAMPRAGLADLPDEVAQIVKSLDAPDWQVRERATNELMDVNPALLPALRSHSRSEISIEASLRLQRAAKELYIVQRTGPAPACLGIRHQRSIDWQMDARVAPGIYAIRIDIVYPDTAAAQAGLKPGDLVIGMNGKIADSNLECDNFTASIFQQKPGERCTFTVLRGIEGRMIVPSKERGVDRRGFRGLATRVVDFTEDGRLGKNAVGLRITSSRNADPRLRLEPGDLIVGIDGQPLKRDTAQETLAAWASQPPEHLMDHNELRNNIPGRNWRRGPNGQLIRAPSPNIQILRGGRRVAIDVTLGRWPLYYSENGRLKTRRAADVNRLIEFESDFEHWWNAPIDSGDQGLSVRRDPAGYWQMEP